MHSKKLMKPLCIIALFGSILLLLSSCSFNELKRFGLGVLTGNPIKNNDPELQTIEVVDNPNNYYRSKISRNYWLFEPKCRNNAEVTYILLPCIAVY